MYWMIFYTIGLAILVAGLLYYAMKGRKERNGLVWLFAFFFCVIFVWYIPIEGQKNTYSVPEAILSAVFRGIGSVKGDSYSKEVSISVQWFESIYSISIMTVKLIIIFLTANVVLSLFKQPYQNIRNWSDRNKKTYIFYKVNSKTINIAKSVADREDARIIFFTDSVMSESERSSVESVKGIFFEKTPEYVFDKIIKAKELKRKGSRIEVFIFGDSDAENLQCMKRLCSNIKDPEREVRVYIELVDASWDIRNDMFVENAGSKNLVINMVITEENFALNNLYSNSIFDNYVEEGHVKTIKLLFIGFDRCSEEMFKTALWLGQMPGFKIETAVIEQGNAYERLAYECPGIKDALDEAGMACYKISHFSGISYETRDFSEAVEKHIGFTFAFINTGNDITNCNIARQLMSCRIRNDIDAECVIQIKNETSVISDQKSWSMIREAGKMSEIYTYDNITNSTIEKVTKMIHDIRQQEKKSKDAEYTVIDWNDYCRDEYKRKSTYARSLAIRYKLKLIHKYHDGDYSLLESSRQWAECEHMRWNVYTWSLGFVKGNRTDLKGKIHIDLIAFNDLPEKIQAYDYVKVDKKTCDILMEDGR